MASLTIRQMRLYVDKAYDTWSWHYKVSKMPDKQIIAIYNKFNSEGRFDRNYRKQVNHPKPESDFKQITLFDIGLSV